MSDCYESIPTIRNLDGAYYRAVRNGRHVSLCFSDLTEAEQNVVMAQYDVEALRRLCHILSGSLRQLGDELNIRLD